MYYFCLIVLTWDLFQAVYKNARDKRFLKKGEKKKKEAPAKHFILRKLIALSKAPAHSIVEGFDMIELECLQLFGHDAGVIDFLNYFRKQWMADIASFCVHGKDVRTNNVVSSAKKFDKNSSNVLYTMR